LGVEARVDVVQWQLNAALQHQASLNAQIPALQEELHVAVAVLESRAVVMAERDASIALITAQLVRALEDEMATSVTLAQARAASVKTIHVFRGLVIQVRLVLATLGLKPPLILSRPDGSITLWFTNIMRQIGSLSERLMQVL
jgi:hypothetical protein